MTVNEKSKEQLLKELKQKNSQLKALKVRLKKQEELFDKVINTTPVGVYIAQDKKIKLFNNMFLKNSGTRKEDLKEMNPVDLILPEDRELARKNSIDMLKGKRTHPFEHRAYWEGGSTSWVMEYVNGIEYEEKPAILGYTININERKQAEEELERHKKHLEELVDERTTELTRQSDIIQRQAQEILDIATPVLRVWEGIIVAPLIGMLDSQRTQQFMEQLLTTIVETNSPIALVDITGVPTIDTQTAQHLIDTISAVRLLGANVILTGVQPSIAQTLVHLGIDLSTVLTSSSLDAGLKIAIGIQSKDT